jgi:hypothetical protein
VEPANGSKQLGRPVAAIIGNNNYRLLALSALLKTGGRTLHEQQGFIEDVVKYVKLIEQS